MSTVLVTGGAGYIGSHAVKALAAAEYDVVVYDDLSAGHREAIDRLRAEFPDRQISFIQGDVRHRSRVSDALRKSKAMSVMHFAAKLSVGESVREPLAYYATNVAGTLSVLRAMADRGLNHFVFSSTAATFGEPIHVPIDETHPQHPINPYGETKLAVEKALQHIALPTGIRSVGLRYFNAAGADPDGWLGEDHSPEEHLVPRALAAVSGGEPLTVFGDDYPTPDGTCVRDYVHVTDLAQAHVLALKHLEGGGATSFYNLGNGKGVSVRELLAAVERVTGKAVPHTIGPRREGDPAVLVASSARIMSDLGWKPALGGIDDIVATAWRWFEAHPKGYKGPHSA